MANERASVWHVNMTGVLYVLTTIVCVACGKLLKDKLQSEALTINSLKHQTVVNTIVVQEHAACCFGVPPRTCVVQIKELPDKRLFTFVTQFDQTILANSAKMTY